MTTDQVLKAAEAEKMLKAIIEAQVKGGCEKYKHSLSYDTHLMDEGINKNYMCDKVYAKAYILEILLDTDGLKAAYGDVFYDEDEEMEEDNGIILNGAPCDVFQSDIGTNIIRKRLTIGWNATAHEILSCWLIESTKSAIKTAYDLLP